MIAPRARSFVGVKPDPQCVILMKRECAGNLLAANSLVVSNPAFIVETI
jgi:hypothetical protein